MATRPRQTTLVMSFQDYERVPEPGDTVIMCGMVGGTKYAVTVHRIISERATGDHLRVLTVKATKRPIV